MNPNINDIKTKYNYQYKNKADNVFLNIFLLQQLLQKNDKIVHECTKRESKK